MKLQAFFFFLALVFAAEIPAQTPRTFVVKEVGNKPVILHHDKKKQKVAPRDLLSLNAMITIPNEGMLVVYDNVRLSEYTIQKAGMNTLAEFLNGSSKASYSKITFAGLIAMLFSNNDERRDVPATIYRGEEGDNNENSIDEYVANIREVLKDSTTNLPKEYAAILTEVLQDIESQSEISNDSTIVHKE